MAYGAPVKSIDPQILAGVYPSKINDINEKGEAVGYSNNTWWYKKAVKWTTNGEMIDLGFLPGTNMSVANGINNNGDIVGYCGQYITLRGGGISDMNYRATMWTAEGEIRDLGTLPGVESIAMEINNHREVVGYTYLRWIEHGETYDSSVRMVYHAILWTAKDGVRDLGALPGGNYSSAYDINDRGQIVGYSRNGTGESGLFHASMWTRDGAITDLGLFPNHRSSIAYGINEQSQVVGYCSITTSAISYRSQAFLWTLKNGMTLLETIPDEYSYANGINDMGQIVGYSYRRASDNSAVYEACLWTAKGNLIKLEPLRGFDFAQAFKINNKGQIIGSAYAYVYMPYLTLIGHPNIKWDSRHNT